MLRRYQFSLDEADGRQPARQVRISISFLGDALSSSQPGRFIKFFFYSIPSWVVLNVVLASKLT
jgi:hypothetical protein